MAYNANNLMTSFTATGVSVQTAYDAAGRRVRKIKNVWDVTDPIQRLIRDRTPVEEAALRDPSVELEDL
jgi:YD repeat-containing protein